MEVSPQTPRVKRRKVRGKQQPPVRYAAVAQQPPEAEEEIESAESDVIQLQLAAVRQNEFQVQFRSMEAYFGMSKKRQYDYIHDIVRSYYIKTVVSADVSFAGCDDLEKGQKVILLRNRFSKLCGEDRNTISKNFAQAMQPPIWLRDAFNHLFLQKKGRPMVLKKNRTKTVLTTFIASWGLRDGDENALQVFPGLSMADAVTKVQSCDAMVGLWNKFRDFAIGMKAATMAGHYAACMEICPRHFEQHEQVKIHLHLFLKSENWLVHADEFCFEAVSCNRCNAYCGLPLGRGRNTNIGFLYCCLSEKIGSCFQYSTQMPWKDFPVRPDWIGNLAACGKMSVRDARALINRCVSGSQRLIRDLDGCAAQLEREQIEADMRMVRGVNTRIDFPWKSLPIVNQWCSQYDSVQSRYCFLVLEGKSRMGKTKFARSLLRQSFSPEQILEITCSSGAEPNLRDFDYSFHKLIIFDEIEPAVVAQSRRIFQAAEGWVDVSCSATNLWAQKKCFWRVPMILCTNLWYSNLAGMSASATDWIKENQMYYHVQAPLWDEAPADNDEQ